MASIKLRNPGPRTFVLSTLVPRPDKAIISTETVVKAGASVLCDDKNPSVRIYAKAGLLLPEGKEAEAWLKKLQAEEGQFSLDAGQ